MGCKLCHNIGTSSIGARGFVFGNQQVLDSGCGLALKRDSSSSVFPQDKKVLCFKATKVMGVGVSVVPPPTWQQSIG